MTLDNDKARELFNQARNLPSAEREPFLDKECADDDGLRDEVETLLSHCFSSAETARSSEHSTSKKAPRHFNVGVLFRIKYLNQFYGHMPQTSRMARMS